MDKRPRQRGRPKALDRDHVLKTALMQYWAHGPLGVSIDEICNAAGASKPGVYREFGSQDGVMSAALDAYGIMVLSPLYKILEADKDIPETLSALVGYMSQDRQPLGLPDGCFHVTARSSHGLLGPLTQGIIQKQHLQTLQNYQRWIERAKEKGQFHSELSTETTALYFDAQNGAAMRLQKEGVSNVIIADILRLAFTPFIST